EPAEALVAAITGGAAPAALERAVEVEAEREEGGHDAEGQGGAEAGADRPPEDAPVEGEDERIAALERGEGVEPIVRPQRDLDRAEAPGGGEEQGLDEERAQQPEARGPQGGAHGQLAGAGDGAGQQQ